MTIEGTDAVSQAQALNSFAAFIESPTAQDLLDRYTPAQIAAGARLRAAILMSKSKDAK